MVSMTFSLPVTRVHSPGVPLIVLSCLLLALLFCCTPCQAVGYIYLDTGEQPALSAHSEGETRYYPGDSFEITAILTNKGRDTAMAVAPLLSPGAYDPSTALGVTVSPRIADAPVTLKSLPVMAGDIGSWDQVPVTLQGAVHQNASPGFYAILLDTTYNYVYAIPMTGTDFTTFTPLYHQKVQVLPVTFRVLGEVRPAVISDTSDNMVPGTQGYLTAEIANTGYATGNEVILSIVPSDNVTFQMVDGSAYLGKFGPGNITTVRARIAVKDHTAAGSYPATLEGQYRDADGVVRSTPPVPIGIKVSRGAVIESVTKNVTIRPGGKETITVTYKNTGDTPAVNAEARIIGNQMLKTETDSASLGYFPPGETKTAQFVISAKESAIPGKHYVIDTEVKYRDSLDALMLSHEMSFGADIQSPTGTKSITQDPVALVIIAGAIAIVAYVAWKLRRKKAWGT
jgi:hypothetical protein